MFRLFLFALCLISISIAKELPSDQNSQTATSSARFDGNNIVCWMSNTGKIVDNRAIRQAGMEWPKGSGKTIDFCSGLWLVGKTPDGELRSASTEYDSEFQPGIIQPDGQPADPQNERFRIYKINSDGTGDWQSWPFDLGAPAVQTKEGIDSLDANGNRLPLLIGDQTLWWVMNDANAAAHSSVFRSQPLGVQISVLAFGFNDLGPLSDVLFFQWDIINKSNTDYDSCYIGLWSDTDLGNASDDLVGCDRKLNVGYTYNGYGADGVYLGHPPCLGFQLLQGAHVENESLPITSFSYWWDTGAPNPYGPPANAREAFEFLKGNLSDGTSVLDHLGYPTRFLFDGNPITSIGHIDSYPSDRLLLVSSGPFNLSAGSRQTILAAKVVGSAETRLASITDMKNTCALLQRFKDFIKRPAHFQEPIVELNAESTESGVQLFWNDVDQQYQNAPSHFLGYKLYYVDDNEELVFIANFDKIDGITQIDDVVDGENIVVYKGDESGLATSFSVQTDAAGQSLTMGKQVRFVLRAFVYHPFAPQGQKVTLNAYIPFVYTHVPSNYTSTYPTHHFQGEGDGNITLVLTRPEYLTGHQYLVKFRNDESTLLVLYDATAGKIVAEKSLWFIRYNPILDVHHDSLGFALYVENQTGIKSVLYSEDPWFAPGNNSTGPFAFAREYRDGVSQSIHSSRWPTDYYPVRIEFQDKSSLQQDGFWSKGFAEFWQNDEYDDRIGFMPLAAYDDRNPDEPRKLEVLLVESPDDTSANAIWDLGWNGDSFLSFGKYSEALVIFDHDYTETPNIDDHPYYRLETDILYVLKMVGKSDREFLDKSFTMTIEPNFGLSPADIFSFTASITDVQQGRKSSPSQFSLRPNYPNPFNAVTRIEYSVLKQSHVKLAIFNILGQHIETLVDETKTPGHYHIAWHAVHHPTGVYIVQMHAGQEVVITRKMALVK